MTPVPQQHTFRHLFTHVTIAATLAVALVGAQPSAIPRYQVTRAAVPVTIDGKLDE